MITIVIAAMLGGAGTEADLRHNFVQCLKTSVEQAKTQKVAIDGYVAFARSTCATSGSPFKAALINADVQHGMSHKDSVSDADSQLDDYFSEWLDHYKSDVDRSGSETAAAPPAPKVTPPPTPAAQPK
jgi:hypothetical protein